MNERAAPLAAGASGQVDSACLGGRVPVSWLALFFLAAAAPGAGILGADFINRDDSALITSLPFWREPTAASIAEILARPIFGSYHPLHQLTYAVDRLVWGPTAFGVRLTQLLLHGACAAALALLGRRLCLSPAAVAVGTLYFALHPTHVESVAWCAQRKDLLMVLFVLLALLTYLGPSPRRLTDPGPPPSWRRTFATLALLLLGVAGKSVAALAVPMLAVVALRRGTLRAEASRLALLGAVGAAAIGIHYVAQQGVLDFPAAELDRRLWRATRATAWYLRSAFLPWGRTPLPSPPAPGPGAAADLGLVLAVVAVGCWSWSRGGQLSVYVAWFLGALVPIVGLVPHPQFAQDHYLLLPTAAAALALGEAFAKLLARARRRQLVKASAACLLVSLGTYAHCYATRAWSSSLALWSWNLAADPETVYGRVLLASALRDAGHAAQARALVEEALDRAPDFPPASCYVAVELFAEGNATRGFALLQRAARSRHSGAADAGALLVDYALQAGDLQLAQEALAALRQRAPSAAPVLARAEGTVRLVHGDLDEAAAAFRLAARRSSGAGEDWALVALTERLLGDVSASEAALALAEGPTADAVAAHLALDAGRIADAERALGRGPPVDFARGSAVARLLLARGQRDAARVTVRALLATRNHRVRHLLAVEPTLRALQREAETELAAESDR